MFQARSSKAWYGYFVENKQAVSAMPWELGVSLSDGERRAVVESMQDFQLGESSEGKHLLAFAARYAHDANDPYYLKCIELFIAEENKHGGFLAEYLKGLGLPCRTRTWTDSVFRALRKWAGLEVSLSVLITAEIIATVYYVALKNATTSPLLQKICDQILYDETRHVRFQSERLAVLRKARGPFLLWFSRMAHIKLFFGTCLVVWLRHAKTFQAGGFSFPQYWHAEWKNFYESLDRMDPRRYASLEVHQDM